MKLNPTSTPSPKYPALTAAAVAAALAASSCQQQPQRTLGAPLPPVPELEEQRTLGIPRYEEPPYEEPPAPLLEFI